MLTTVIIRVLVLDTPTENNTTVLQPVFISVRAMLSFRLIDKHGPFDTGADPGIADRGPNFE